MIELISIAGESGVGKTTIARLVERFHEPSPVVMLSGDDLHRWERNNPRWKEISHLNPDANRLKLGDVHLMTLLSGYPIARSHYNHHTGLFELPQIVYPHSVIVNEGLHAFYTSFARTESTFKIFVAACELLRTHWKIQRDTQFRGYTREEVLANIELRRSDAKHIKDEQIENADLIIRIETVEAIKEIGSDESVTVKFDFIQDGNKKPELVEYLKQKL